MIKDADRAKKVSTAAEAFIRELSAALHAAQDAGDETEFEMLKSASAKIVGSLEGYLLWPLYTKHPTLEPPELKDWKGDNEA